MTISIKENNSGTIKCAVKKGDGTIQDVSSWVFYFKVADSLGVTLFLKDSTNIANINVTNPTSGLVEVYINPTDTDDRVGNYKYEFKGFDPLGHEYTLKGPADFVITPTII